MTDMASGAMPAPPNQRFVLALTFGLFFLVALSVPASAAQLAGAKTSQIAEHLRRAQAALMEHHPVLAAKELRAVLALDPRNSAAYSNLGAIAFFQNDCQNATQDFRRALAIRPGLANAQALLGICESRSGNSNAVVMLRSSFAKLKDKKLRIAAGIELANTYDREGHVEQASSVMKSLVNLDPDNINILYMAQRVYTELADDTLNKLALLAPGSARMQQVIAEKLVNGGDLSGAILHYKNALKLDPYLAGVHFELGEAILQSSSHDPKSQADADEEFETAEKNEGDTAGIECEMGRIALLRSNLQQAFAHYHQAIALNPGNPQAQLGLGRVLLTMQRPQEALGHLRVAAQSDPLNGQARYQLAIAYRDLHLTDQARQQMRIFDEIEHAMRQVRALYRQMGRRAALPEEEAGDVEK